MPNDSTNPSPKSEHEATAAFAKPHDYVSAGDERLAYWRFGRGPDVVLVHGWPLHSATFRRIVPALARDFTLHLFDLPGVGWSEAHGRVGLREHGETLRRAIGALGLERYGVLAHDSGAVIARLAVADDDRLRGLVFAGSEIPGHRPWLVVTYSKITKVPGVTPLVVASMRLGFVRRSFLGFGGCFRDPAYVDGDFGDLFVKPLVASRRVAEGHIALVRGVDWTVVDRLAEVHARIRAPVRMIWGTKDPFFPIALARATLGQFPGGADLVEIPGAKLFPHEDHPEELVGHAAPFLERCLGGATRIGAQV